METAFHTTGTRSEEGCSRSVQMEFAVWPEQCHGGWRGGRKEWWLDGGRLSDVRYGEAKLTNP